MGNQRLATKIGREDFSFGIPYDLFPQMVGSDKVAIIFPEPVFYGIRPKYQTPTKTGDQTQ
jgi:hypothetical protein